MHLKSIELSGFKSFAKKSVLEFRSPIAGIVGPNGSGKSNVAEAFRFVLGEQSMKSMRGKRGPDLIWSGNERTPRANRARIAVTFDNRSGKSGKPLLDIDFDEVVIERTVYRDGTNEYAVNGSKVRLKDVGALLASANIGASGHHIISQGEADRILGASAKERREMIEDALGLKVYQFKKAESERKLERTNENMKEVRALRREIAPHMKFLERQMGKLKRARELKDELTTLYKQYVSRERHYMQNEEERLKDASKEPASELERITKRISEIKAQEKAEEEIVSARQKADDIESKLVALNNKKSELERELGRLEGRIEASKQKHPDTSPDAYIPATDALQEFSQVDEALSRALLSNDTSLIHEVLTGVRSRISIFLEKLTRTSETPGESRQILRGLQEEKENLEKTIASGITQEKKLLEDKRNVIESIEAKRGAEREAERELFGLKEKQGALERRIDAIRRDRDALARDKERLSHVLHDAGEVIENEELQNITADIPSEPTTGRLQQEESLRAIERVRARFEEANTVDSETVKEYDDTKKRDEFLEREVEDLDKTQRSLLDVIGSLEHELENRFAEGLEKINEEFQEFFSILFDGGDARLKLVKKEKRKQEDSEDSVFKEEDSNEKEGIDIEVKLPRKNVATLEVLSGGERALTSIALIFAMSQVNPPPFIVLDETDAALDEANSRKYADMVRALSEHSQLILITHNRRTMEAAGELYGITMGSDGISKLLSVKFEAAVNVVK
jgi:chromosome segregation protein